MTTAAMRSGTATSSARPSTAATCTSGDHEELDLQSEVGSLGLADSGKLVVALRDEVGMFDPEDGATNGSPRSRPIGRRPG